MLDAALEYAEKGFSVIPVDQKKISLIKWEPYQSSKASKKQIETWWTKFPTANIGIVTGEISNLLIVDTDTESAIEKINNAIPEGLDVPCQTTPKGGRHFVFAHYPGLVNRARVADGIDLRTNGGYFVAAPSINGNGKEWKWLFSPMQATPPEIPQSVLSIISTNVLYKESSFNSSQMSSLSSGVVFFQEGRRDEDLFHVANLMVKGGGEKQFIFNTLRRLMLSWGELDDKWADTKINSAIQRAEKKERNLTEEVREWVLSSTGVFLSSEVAKCLHLSSREEDKHLSKILSRLCEDEKLIERYGNRRGSYRVKEEDCNELDWKSSTDKEIRFSFPMGIEDLVEIYPENIIVIAGEKDAGKTAFLLNCAIMNANRYEIFYFSSEMSKMELRKRIKKFGFPDSKWEQVHFLDRAHDFHDVIKPDGINIVDFLEVHDEFYKIGGTIKKIADKLKQGIALIGIQKNPGTDYGLGGMRGVERARVYVSLEASSVNKLGKAKITVGKNRRFEDINPVGMIMEYSLRGGALFTNHSDKWHHEKKEKVYPKTHFDKEE